MVSIFNRLNLLIWEASHYVNQRVYATDHRIHETLVGKVATILFVLNILFMTRFYALSNIVETVLYLQFLVYPSLRKELCRTLRDPMIACLMAFFAWILFSGLWSSASLYDVLDNWWSWRKLLLLPIGLILLRFRRSYLIALKTFAAVGIFYFLCSIIMLSLGVEQFWGRPYTHILQNHNAQGVYFSILGLGFILLGVTRIRSGNPLGSWLLILGSSFIILTLAFGSSRSGYVSSMIALGLAGYSICNRKIIGFLIGTCIAFTIVFCSPQATSRINQAMTEMQVGASTGGESTSGSIRVVMWLNSIEVVKDHWLLGTGPGGFARAYEDVVENQVTEGWRKTITDDPHQQYLHIWASYGVVGLLLYLFFLGLVFLRSLDAGDRGLMSIALLAIITSVGFFNGVLGASVEGRTILIALALTFCTPLTNKDRIRVEKE